MAETSNASFNNRGLPADQARRFNCPHCGNRIQLVEPRQSEVVCLNCGSSFHVDPELTVTYRGTAPGGMIGRFQVVELLGRGAFGEVYKAHDSELDRAVAIKVPRAEYFSTAEERERFLREARSAAGLRHPGIVQVHEIAHDQGLPYIVSEYIEGLTLADLISGGRPGFRESAELVALMAEALDFAHRQKVIHRDVKPSNILLAPSATETAISSGSARFIPYLTDFGLARRDEGEITVTLDGQVLGTPAYMSPEQAAGDHARVNGRSDVYSLGVVLYELIAGELPFRGNRRMLLHQVLHDEPRSPRTLNDQIPRDLETICLTAMAKEPGRRYATAAALADDLRRYLRGEVIDARPVGRIERVFRWSRRNPILAFVSGTAVLALLTAAVVSTVFAVYHARTSKELADKSDDLKDALDESEKHRQLAQDQAARVLFERAMREAHAEDADTRLVLFHLCDALDAAPARAGDVERAIRTSLAIFGQKVASPVMLARTSDRMNAASPDGTLAGIITSDGLARVIDTRTGKPVRTISSPGARINAIVEFSIDNRYVALRCSDETVSIWDMGGGSEPVRRLGKQPHLSSLRFSPGSESFATLSLGDIRIYDIDHEDDGQVANLLESGDLHYLCADRQTLVFRRDDWYTLEEGQRRDIAILNATSGGSPAALERVVGHNAITAFAARRDGRLMVTGAADGFVHFWTADWQQARPPARLEGPVELLHFSSDERDLLMATGRTLGTLHLGEPPGLSDGTPQISTYRLDFSKSFAALHDRTIWIGKFRSTGDYFTVELLTGIMPAGEGACYFASLGNNLLAHGQCTSQLRSDNGVDVHATSAIDPRIIYSGYDYPRRSAYELDREFCPKVIAPLVVGGNAKLIRLWTKVVTCCVLSENDRLEELSEADWEESRRQLAELTADDPSGLIQAAANDRLRWCRAQIYRDEPKNKSATLMRALVEEGAHHRVMAILDRLVEGEPNDGRHFALRGELRALRGEFDRAARDLAQSQKLATTDFDVTNAPDYALIYLAANALEPYRAARQKTWRGRTEDRIPAVMAYCLGPDDLSPAAPIVSQLEEESWEKSIERENAGKALALYAIRTGRPQRAIEILKPNLEAGTFKQPASELLLALAFLKSGDDAAAHSWQAKVNDAGSAKSAGNRLVDVEEFLIRRLYNDSQPHPE